MEFRIVNDSMTVCVDLSEVLPQNCGSSAWGMTVNGVCKYVCVFELVVSLSVSQSVCQRSLFVVS